MRAFYYHLCIHYLDASEVSTRWASVTNESKANEKKLKRSNEMGWGREESRET